MIAAAVGLFICTARYILPALIIGRACRDFIRKFGENRDEELFPIYPSEIRGAALVSCIIRRGDAATRFNRTKYRRLINRLHVAISNDEASAADLTRSRESERMQEG